MCRRAELRDDQYSACVGLLGVWTQSHAVLNMIRASIACSGCPVMPSLRREIDCDSGVSANRNFKKGFVGECRNAGSGGPQLCHSNMKSLVRKFALLGQIVSQTGK